MDGIDLDANSELSALVPYCHMLYDASEECISINGMNEEMVYLNPALSAVLHNHPSVDKYNQNINTHKSIFSLFFETLRHVISTKVPAQVMLSVPPIITSRHVHDWIFMHPIFNTSGHMIGVFSSGRNMDYASHLRTEEYKRHNTYLHALLDTFPFLVWMKDKQGKFLAVNQQFASAVNESEPKFLFGKTDFDYWPKEMAQGYVDDDNEVLSTGLPKNVEERIQKADGEIYWAETYKSPVSIDGQTIGTVGFARDISERQNLLSEIHQKHAEYQSLLEHLPMSIIRYDTNCRRIFINDKYSNRHQGSLTFESHLTPEEQWHPNIINVTGAEYTQQLREVIRTGNAHDFEVKTRVGDGIHVSTVKLVPEYDRTNRITGVLAIIQDVTETYEYRQKIEHLAYYDGITQLPNRSHFQEQLQNQLAQAKRSGSPLCVMMLDLDHFKSINDELGHSVGDNMLTEVASRLKGITAENTLLSRLGGDEFAILITYYSSADEIIHLANEIVSVMAPPFLIEERDIFLSASIGIATYPEHADTPSDLMKYADAAMYLAKKQGRNTYQFFVADINESNAFNHLMRTELRHAIQREEFFIEYQPIFDIQQNCIIKYEALLRWNSPVLRFMGPDKFIPVAEEYGLINEIGNWVMLRVCRDAVLVNRQIPEPIVFALNLSPRQFTRNNLIDTLRTCLLTSGVPASQLEFEITEGLLMENSPEIFNSLEFFHTQGITLSIDDFGTGYSSLSYLSKFPISTVKIDKSFIRDITTDQKDATLTKAIINMGDSLGKKLTAEGIETEAQLNLLQKWGCQLGQGYLLGRPRRLEFILDDIAQGRHGHRQ